MDSGLYCNNHFSHEMKLPIPFMLADDDWKNLKTKEIDLLGRRKFRDKEQEKQLEIFHQMDLRVEWVCQRTVLINNMLIYLWIAFLLFHGPQVYVMLRNWIIHE